MVIAKVELDRAIPAGLSRIHFHDCAVNGCDASVLLEGAGKERDGGGNPTLQKGALDLIDAIKAELDNRCGSATVSCADILSFATRDAIVAAGGPTWPLQFGRLDGSNSTARAANEWLPSPFDTPTSGLGQNFGWWNMTMAEMVAASGAHTLGDAGCPAIADRLRNDRDVSQAMTHCREKCATDFTSRFHMDAGQPAVVPPAGGRTFDTGFYRNVLDGHGLLTSDRTLGTDAATRALTVEYANNRDRFFRDFANVMVKISALPANSIRRHGVNSPAVPVYPNNPLGIRFGSCSRPTGLRSV